MKVIYFLFEILGLIFGVIGYILLNLKSESKLLLVIAIALVAIGLILIFGTIVLEKYMWWTSLGW
ncbi:hypothetical protein H3U50_08340 [Lactobacillus sp. M0398]|uniref:hypothetical protein n=1 Tax=unclassified Lactobacillus TaxID=2620435 RepID=UPI0018DBE02C|nr:MULTISPECIES: hypothetical protein [unclassified Lactobacillus]MBI0121805.1 hypothetical protein [Lactobacillus sp. M0398]MBI0122100.1 hypothetical protein [Lactobacillus sp. W8174]MBI0134836.1 hypothetical protein [Lactobacillus sp. W8173]